MTVSGKQLLSTLFLTSLVLAGCGGSSSEPNPDPDNSADDPIVQDPPNEDPPNEDPPNEDPPAEDPPEEPANYNVSLSWDMPTERENGDPIFTSELASYRIYISSDDETDYQPIDINSGATTEYSVEQIPAGTYEFRIVAIDTDDLTSDFSTTLVVEVGPNS